jgi:hypothetical protein
LIFVRRSRLEKAPTTLLEVADALNKYEREQYSDAQAIVTKQRLRSLVVQVERRGLPLSSAEYRELSEFLDSLEDFDSRLRERVGALLRANKDSNQAGT